MAGKVKSVTPEPLWRWVLDRAPAAGAVSIVVGKDETGPVLARLQRRDIVGMERLGAEEVRFQYSPWADIPVMEPHE